MLSNIKTLAFAATLTATISSTSVTARDVYQYTFDAEDAVGITGSIQVKYDEADTSTAKIVADMDFANVDLKAIEAFDGNCTSEIVQYKWHIHVNWGAETESASLAQCSKALTGNHYDPLKACGSASEFAGTPECLEKVADYSCSPDAYASDSSVCEKGDLSGKFGAFKLDDDKKVTGEWVDEDYPPQSEVTPEWSIVLHAVCGKEAPRIACAVGKKVTDKCRSL